jgi:hypothetical protein
LVDLFALSPLRVFGWRQHFSRHMIMRGGGGPVPAGAAWGDTPPKACLQAGLGSLLRAIRIAVVGGQGGPIREAAGGAGYDAIGSIFLRIRVTLA